jgi:hypothetical protein
MEEEEQESLADEEFLFFEQALEDSLDFEADLDDLPL